MSDQLTGETPVDSFERLYRLQSDPWDFDSSTYERDRYAAILQCLHRSHYDHAFEPGCSIGVLTSLLAPRCRQLLAMDVAPSAVQRATQRCEGLSSVEIKVGDLRRLSYGRPFDLIVFSEIGYYFTAEHLRDLAGKLSARLSPHGELLACHWLGHSKDHVLHGDEVHSILLQALPLIPQYSERHRHFRIDSWVR
jgi:cyclopropane fatty-acyl-phospholipid synthase-like methyltransferase